MNNYFKCNEKCGMLLDVDRFDRLEHPSTSASAVVSQKKEMNVPGSQNNEVIVPGSQRNEVIVPGSQKNEVIVPEIMHS